MGAGRGRGERVREIEEGKKGGGRRMKRGGGGR